MELATLIDGIKRVRVATDHSGSVLDLLDCWLRPHLGQAADLAVA